MPSVVALYSTERCIHSVALSRSFCGTAAASSARAGPAERPVNMIAAAAEAFRTPRTGMRIVVISELPFGLRTLWPCLFGTAKDGIARAAPSHASLGVVGRRRQRL